MKQLPEICVSLCGAVGLVAAVLLPAMVRALRNAPMRNEWR